MGDGKDSRAFLVKQMHGTREAQAQCENVKPVKKSMRLILKALRDSIFA